MRIWTYQGCPWLVHTAERGRIGLCPAMPQSLPLFEYEVSLGSVGLSYYLHSTEAL